MSKQTRCRATGLLEGILIAAAIIGVGYLMRTVVYGYWRAAYPDTYRESVVQAAQKYELSSSLVFAVIHTESHFQPQAVSHAGAVGLMQVTEPTLQWVQMRDHSITAQAEQLADPQVNIPVGCCVLSLLRQEFANEDTAIAAYNAGIGRVRGWLADPRYSADGVTLHTIPIQETAQYVQKVRKTQDVYKKLYQIP